MRHVSVVVLFSTYKTFKTSGSFFIHVSRNDAGGRASKQPEWSSSGSILFGALAYNGQPAFSCTFLLTFNLDSSFTLPLTTAVANFGHLICLQQNILGFSAPAALTLQEIIHRTDGSTFAWMIPRFIIFTTLLFILWVFGYAWGDQEGNSWKMRTYGHDTRFGSLGQYPDFMGQLVSLHGLWA